jgi:hypothetical protein
MTRAAAPFDQHNEWAVFLSNGRVVAGNSLVDWALLPSTGIVAIVAFFAATYRCYANGVWETRRYRNVIHGREDYWVSDAPMFIENDKTGSVMPNLAEALTIKTGAVVPDAEWRMLMNQLFNMHAMPVVTQWK